MSLPCHPGLAVVAAMIAPTGTQAVGVYGALLHWAAVSILEVVVSLGCHHPPLWGALTLPGEGVVGDLGCQPCGRHCFRWRKGVVGGLNCTRHAVARGAVVEEL